ncbi:sigma 54-interacting transcriptional regulator [Clostridium guangxiense]|uniref:sigma 54-interacting transcriptional regulator n=1 Tax=Clostridium guangxiense TaxID=1662055 RepID=UPI001E498B64|nr:sigma 54-interacting transcriptional regulator [Clostridium guangxiense]MCD2346907.1 sigma 54-interacting transcriptional regulator [Clostridium guangxiense]
MEKIKEIISSEDKKNPYTDEEISKMLNITRGEVINYRKLLNIPDSRERRKKLLVEEIYKILEENYKISERGLTEELIKRGFKVSRNIVSRYLKEVKLDNFNSNEVKRERNFEEREKNRAVENEVFDDLIGAKGSLRAKIDQAKASMLYPPNGLHTLIYGETGVGKSQLAECMYRFAIQSGIKGKGAPFIAFNCADYSENSNLLLAQLFGYVKGAYTGADISKEGLVEKANNGILFLDEIHRLPPEGQEILFSLIDKQKFRRLGETQNTRSVNVMLIGATTETPEGSLLLTFRRRIPMLIELPSLHERPLAERYEIIVQFFTKEATRINRNIIVNTDVLKSLMLYNCVGNIGQLRSDIQVACARSFLNAMYKNNKDVQINVFDLPNHVKNELLKIKKRGPEIEEFVSNNLIVNPNDCNKTDNKEDRYMLPNKIYQYIERKFTQMENNGYKTEEINNIIGDQVEKELEKFAKKNQINKFMSRGDLEGVVDQFIIDTVEKSLDIANKYLSDIQDNLFYSLAIHLNEAYYRIKSGKIIVNPQLGKIIIKHKEEYKVAELMARQIGNDLGIVIPKDEIGFIAMYISAFRKENNKGSGRVRVIILTHGHVACGIADVVDKLLGVDNVVGIEMELDESPESAMKRTLEVVKKIDEGKGCILLIDMGSLITFGEIITKKTGISTKVLGRVDTVLALEVARRACIEENNLDEIIDAVSNNRDYVGKMEGANYVKKLSKTIITLCITGEGTAINIKKYIEDLIPEIKEEVNIMPLGVLNQDDIKDKIYKLSQQNNIVAIVGTINVNVNNIPFISFEDVLNGYGINRIKDILSIVGKDTSSLNKVISEDLILVDVDASYKNEVIDILINVLKDKNLVDEQFMLSVYKREAMGTTLLHNEIAIPHGFPQHVIKSSICMAKLSRPIEWEAGKKTSFVMLIALKENEENNLVQLIKIFNNKEYRTLINKATEGKEILDIILRKK